MAALSSECVSEMQLNIMKSHNSHPSFGHLVMLVFEAVMEVVCVSLPGYIIARLGHFDAEKQKFLANLNVMLFTPCLIFTKLASQLDPDKFIELGVIPIIFVLMTIVSYGVSIVVTRMFRFNKRAANFVTAMGVFGNSNSLPISLVISLSQTLKGLHWDKVPGDNDDQVAARGVLYLMIFQQLGQVVRWSWGYHVLLAPKSKYDDGRSDVTEGDRYRDDPEGAQTDEEQRLLATDGTVVSDDGEHEREHEHSGSTAHSPVTEYSDDVFDPSGRTPVAPRSHGSPYASDAEDNSSQGGRTPKKRSSKPLIRTASDADFAAGLPTDSNGEHILSFPRIRNITEPEIPAGVEGVLVRVEIVRARAAQWATVTGTRVFEALPRPVQFVLSAFYSVWLRVYNFLSEFMNPPLWAMLIAVIVASNPALKTLFFKEGTFVNNSVTSAITQTAGVAVPLILVVLGANLARNTQSNESHDPEEDQIGTKLLVASLVCRMLLPTLIMAPILAVFAKYVPVSILDDPIFVIVCFLLTGAPSALQLAQICQINGVYEKTMSKILFQSYVIWILPSTLILVVCALEVVEWAQ
ncbi:auxin efflux carrier superfamily [Ophiostoma piceae UAMH 11346]|uniref:Auxin efflux carrier superfamily n=1 Tax=Ophiostoma piceae (strain UAMH 11346) TaxID=1262450 RepID=S3C6J8_OPHP1|nr:auxin efflux carrier superfamily [Ophiostoma piceae UAMH 11346]